MKLTTLALLSTIFLSACNQATEIPVEKVVHIAPEKAAFFPVTDYIKGQITEIRNNGVNPQQFVRINNHIDSSWLKVEAFDSAFGMFLSPVIDSMSLSPLFAEKKFFDQTIDAITLTYDPLKILPDSFLLQRWDVYIDPEKNTVRRIYLLKKTPDHKTIQLTWQSDIQCKVVTISDDTEGNAHVEKEVTIKWDF
ncbi:hypothetical protein BH11BAC4_BH11BAC4_11550 [soil metagenome]